MLSHTYSAEESQSFENRDLFFYENVAIEAASSTTCKSADSEVWLIAMPWNTGRGGGLSLWAKVNWNSSSRVRIFPTTI